jgi:Flp pilus assembly protein TadG
VTNLSTLIRQAWSAMMRCQRGGSSTEFALIAVVFLSMVLGLVDMGRFYYTRSSIEFAGERVLREALVAQAV